MKNKVFWFDVETTGLQDYKNDIIQLAALMEIEGKVVDEIELKIQPINPEAVDLKALQVNGVTLEELDTYLPPLKAWDFLFAFLDKHINRYDKEDKATLAGYNVGFDKGFLMQFWKKLNKGYFHSWFHYKPLDVYSIVIFQDWLAGKVGINQKLITACAAHGVELGEAAHDALADIRATRELAYKLAEEAGWKK